MVQFANSVVQMLMQAGPLADLPTRVPGFVGNVLNEVSSAAGGESGGLSEQISALTPDGSEATDGTGAAAENTDAAKG